MKSDILGFALIGTFEPGRGSQGIIEQVEGPSGVLEGPRESLARVGESLEAGMSG